MADDAVFLVPGRPPMRKPDFAAAARAQQGPEAPRFDGTSEIEEIVVVGDWAFMRTRLTVLATVSNRSRPTQRAGYTMTILKKHNGKWVLARDANLLAPVPEQ